MDTSARDINPGLNKVPSDYLRMERVSLPWSRGKIGSRILAPMGKLAEKHIPESLGGCGCCVWVTGYNWWQRDGMIWVNLEEPTEGCGELLGTKKKGTSMLLAERGDVRVWGLFQWGMLVLDMSRTKAQVFQLVAGNLSLKLNWEVRAWQYSGVIVICQKNTNEISVISWREFLEWEKWYILDGF